MASSHDSAPCVASRRRLAWALLRATGDPAARRYDFTGWTIAHARALADEANVALAALYLPDPSRWELTKAWAYGVYRTLRYGPAGPGSTKEER